ncbi:hypothetical protein BJ165DRAFT_1534086 [Panaeolus papilionaceus]|nr:hypothetical protein BJ165DRAFT_1534086 [Panaeolus papilionaceus]
MSDTQPTVNHNFHPNVHQLTCSPLSLISKRSLFTITLAMEIPELENLSITGDISVEPVTTRIPKKPYPYIFLIMGPTGAGKSSFIEALAGESQKLWISKDQLAGYTQTVSAYRLVNVVLRGWDPPRPVYLIDTPGFSDLKISEIEVVNMVKKWSQENDLDYAASILYLTPITETRLPRSRRKTFNMLKRLFRGYYASLVIITTMWDTVHNKQTRNRAESNFAQLRDETLKEFVEHPSTDVIKFTNTKNSALLAIDRKSYATHVFNDYTTSKSRFLYQDLHERIQGALQEKQIIELDLAQHEAQIKDNLRTILESNRRENNRTLTKFINQFVNFGELPLECRDAAYHLRKSIAANARPANIKQRILFWKWAQEPEPAEDVESNDCAVASQPLVLKDLVRFAFTASMRHVAKVFKHRK